MSDGTTREGTRNRTPPGEFLRWLRDCVANRDRNQGCWIDWPGHSVANNYPHCRFEGRRRQGSHVALELDGKPRPDASMEALHSCDNSFCVNPGHLRWGTHQENQREMVQRSTFMAHVAQRDYYGAANPKAKLTDSDVLEIRRRRAAGEVQQRIADDFGITQVNVSEICLGKTWRHLL